MHDKLGEIKTLDTFGKKKAIDYDALNIALENDQFYPDIN